MIVGDILRRQTMLRPEQTAIACGDRQLTYRQLHERTNRAANALAGVGIRKGERVAVLANNCSEFLELYFANGKLGSVTTPLNYRLMGPELEYIINNSEATALVVGDEFVPTVAAIKGLLPTVRQFVCIGGHHEGYLDYEEWVAAGAATEPATDVSENDLIWQMYTSGTTGRPKGAMISHRALLTNVMQTALEVSIAATDRTLVVAPLYHAAAMINAMTNLAMGGTLVVKTGFDPGEVLRTFAADGIAHVLLVPAMILALLHTPGVASADLRSLKTIIYGASAIPVEVLRAAMQTFKCDFLQGYGQTESTAVLTLLRAEDHILDGPPDVVRRLQSCGREVFGCQVRVVDQNGTDVRPGDIGEIIGRGHQLMTGYWKLPEATASALQDGWLHTGDLGTVDDQHFIYVMDRLKDMIVSGGENVFPREIEEVLFAHPAVADAACIGVPSEQWGEEVKAIVVLKEGHTASDEELIAFCGERLAGFKRPRSVEFRDALPKNPSGKVLKRELREPFWQDQTRRVH
jgi:acyl-CoA synthetase (AMP-forming)/AMP-acid ligase II